MKPVIKSSSAITRYEKNPILTYKDCPYKSNLVFNAGVAKWNGKYIMIFRNDYGHDGIDFEGTNLGLASSEDGVHWEVEPIPFFTPDMIKDKEIRRFYDPRLTVIDGELLMCFAVDTAHGIRGGVGRISDDLKNLEVLSMSAPDNRNFVLFPEKIDGMYVRLERPFPVYGRNGVDRFDIWISKSPDLIHWGEHELLLGVEHVPYANDKIGPAAPPLKTDKGWLTVFHAVDRDESRGKHGWEPKWTKRYSAGIMLLDLEDPTKVIGMYKEPLIAPEASYEIKDGFRDYVIFPCGILKDDNDKVNIYYGAGDAVICLATADLNDLIDLCSEPK